MEQPPSFWKLKKKVGKGAVTVKGLDKLLRHKKNPERRSSGLQRQQCYGTAFIFVLPIRLTREE